MENDENNKRRIWIEEIGRKLIESIEVEISFRKNIPLTDYELGLIFTADSVEYNNDNYVLHYNFDINGRSCNNNSKLSSEITTIECDNKND